MRCAATARHDEGDSQIGVDLFRYAGSKAISENDVHLIAGHVRHGVLGPCPECTFVATCAGNIDNDDTLDVWSIATFERDDPNGQKIPAGVPFNDLNDVIE